MLISSTIISLKPELKVSGTFCMYSDLITYFEHMQNCQSATIDR